MDALWQDLRYGLRALARKPGFTTVIVITLALGIGANTAMFSVVDAVLLRPFPYQDPDRIVLLWGSTDYETRRGISWPDLQYWRSQNQVFEDIIPFLGGGMYTVSLSLNKDSEASAKTAYAAPGLFSLLGVQPTLGRAFLQEESFPGKEKVVVLSYGFWQRRFGGNSDLIGQSISLGDELYTVVGIMPPGFFFPEPGIDVWAAMPTNFMGMDMRGNRMVQAVARLKPDVNIERARSEMNRITQRLEQAYPDTNKDVRAGVFSLHRVVVREFQTVLWTLLGAVGLVLLIACANVGNLLLARGMDREKEIATRAALGASPGHIIRLLLTESLLLALLGGAAGLLLAYWSVELIRDLRLLDIPRIEQAELNDRVLFFTLGLSVLTGLLFGLAPALRSSRVNLADSLKLGGVTSKVSGRDHLRDLLVVAEVALALVLLISASLLIQSFVRLSTVEWGFNSENVIVMGIRLPRLEYKEHHRQTEFVESVRSRLQSLPGVKSVAGAYVTPIRGTGTTFGFLSLDGDTAPKDLNNFQFIIGQDYFRTLGIPVMQGREFTDRDGPFSTKTVVVSQELAKKLWGDDNPIGRHVYFMQLREDIQKSIRRQRFRMPDQIILKNPRSWKKAEEDAREVIGVAGNVRMFGLETESYPAIYVNHTQPLRTLSPSVTFLVRTAGNPIDLIDAVKISIRDIDEHVSYREITTMQELVSQSIGGRGSNKLLLVVSIAFASLALFLSVVGTYSVISRTVGERAHELGVRMALGAQPADLLKVVLKQGIQPVLAGLLLGLAGAWATTRILSSFLFSVEATDLWTYAGVSLLLIAATLLACYLPARRAAKLDPMIVLRSE